MKRSGESRLRAVVALRHLAQPRTLLDLLEERFATQDGILRLGPVGEPLPGPLCHLVAASAGNAATDG